MKTLSLIATFAFLITSCSYFEYQRTPANDEVLQTQDEVLQVFQFRSSDQTGNVDYRKSIQNFVTSRSIFLGTYGTGNEIAVDFVEDSTLPKGIAYFPEFLVKNNEYKIIVLHSPEGIKDPVASAELVNFLRTLATNTYFVSHFAAFEMYYNAIEQDPLTTQNWAKIREAAAKMDVTSEFKAGEEGLKIRAAEWEKEKEDYDEMAKKAIKQQKDKDLERRAVIESLDKASSDKQFKNLVAQNDRKGVANLLEKYLPWEQMAPFEKRYWETYLDSIVNPLPIDQRILIYRGVDDDVIYSAYKDGKELPKEIAQKEGNIFVMSTIITKNQGTWNRRLRSLTAMYEKFIAINSQNSDEYTKSARIVTMFVNHSRDPKGSPFLSFTPKFEVAQRFGSKRVSAYAIDPRLISFNFASKYKNEVEFLLPLMAFPEDVVGFIDTGIHTELNPSETLMKNMFKEKLIKEHGDQEGSEIYKKVLVNSKTYFDTALNRYEGKKTAAVPKEPGFFGKFFNKIFAKKVIPVPAPEQIMPKGHITCIDIITSFWK